MIKFGYTIILLKNAIILESEFLITASFKAYNVKI